MIPLKKLMMQRKLALHVQVPKMNVHQWLHMKEEGTKPRSSSLNPYLKEGSKYSCLSYALDMIDSTSTSQFCNMYDNINEKGFYLTCDKLCFILADDEIPPHRAICNKGNVTKVMFWCFIACPCYNNGIHSWPEGSWKPAEQASQNQLSCEKQEYNSCGKL